VNWHFGILRCPFSLLDDLLDDILDELLGLSTLDEVALGEVSLEEVALCEVKRVLRLWHPPLTAMEEGRDVIGLYVVVWGL